MAASCGRDAPSCPVVVPLSCLFLDRPVMLNVANDDGVLSRQHRVIRRRSHCPLTCSPNSTCCVMPQHAIYPMHFCIGKSRRVCCTASATARRDECDRRNTQLSLLCNVYKVMITVICLLFNVSYSLIYRSIHLFNLFRLTLTNRNCMCKEK